MPLPPFQSLIDAHGVDIHRFLIASVGAGDADDCYQETWLSALRAYPRLRDASQLRAWLFTIAHRKAIDHVRARRRAPTPVPDLGDGATASLTTGALPGDALPDAELWARVAALPDKQRTAVALRFVADCAYAEIAGAMATTEQAARRNVHEALTRLRKDPPS
ncbi:MAG: sigma-70 family RNA polymerase sigma factor [Solirubrobacteraceae bacterium]